MSLPIIVKAKGNDSTNDVIRKFKKVVAATDIVQKTKDRAFYQRPSQIAKVPKTINARLRKRLHSMKRMKNVTPDDLQRIVKQLS